MNFERVFFDQQQLFQNKPLGHIRSVDFEKHIQSKEITVITGLRRSGKSTLLRQFAEHFTNYHFVHFDDERLLNFSIEDFDTMMVLLQKQHQHKVLFLDEIQNIPRWEFFVRRIYEEGYKIFLTGSNSELLSSEISSRLTGRYQKLELYPFSFAEFLSFHNQSTDNITSTQVSQILTYFDTYQKYGGIPEMVKHQDLEYIQRIYDDIIYRDLVVRFGIRDVHTFRQLAQYIISNIGKPHTYSSLMKSVEMNNSHTTKQYVSALEQAYLIFEHFPFEYSLKKQIRKAKKYYTIDNGLFQRIGFSMSEDRGRLLENSIFIELKRRQQKVFSLQQKNECDFVIKSNHTISSAIQVCHEITKENKQREYNGLLEAMQLGSLNEGILLTYNQEYRESIEGKSIVVMPAWKWLLGL